MNDNDNSPERRVAPVQETEEDLCRALWLATIVQALLDATGNPRNEEDKLEARHWLEGRNCPTSDFAEVCDLAGIDFEIGGRFVTKVLEGKLDCIDFRCTKKAQLRNRSQESRKRYFRRADRNARMRSEQRKRLLFPNAAMVASAANDNSINQSMENYA